MLEPYEILYIDAGDTNTFVDTTADALKKLYLAGEVDKHVQYTTPSETMTLDVAGYFSEDVDSILTQNIGNTWYIFNVKAGGFY